MNERIQELLVKVEPDLAQEIRRELLRQDARDRECQARQFLGATIDMYGDYADHPAIDAASDAYIDAQNDRLREVDPDAYWEQKQMGLL